MSLLRPSYIVLVYAGVPKKWDKWFLFRADTPSILSPGHCLHTVPELLCCDAPPLPYVIGVERMAESEPIGFQQHDI